MSGRGFDPPKPNTGANAVSYCKITGHSPGNSVATNHRRSKLKNHRGGAQIISFPRK